ncbi:MAG TPA: BlaI/MecI/CopY family transcriptional regulator [Fimbriimonadaceae bacterium]|jgi:BlaI family penicillinase repressor
MKQIKLGSVQAQIMSVLWEKKEATAKDITDALSEHEPVSLSTVQTLLRQLERKQVVRHVAKGRTFYFEPAIEPNQSVENSMDRVLNRFYGGSVVGFVAQFLKNERISQEELDELKKLIEAQEKKEGSR